MKKIVISTILLIGLFSIKGFANNVTDDLGPHDNVNQGAILTYDSSHGNTQGTWVDPSNIPGLKGDQGIQGVPGNDGLNGVDGVKGDKGDKGDQGADVDPTTITNLQTQVTNNTNSTDQIRSNLRDTNARVDSLGNDVKGLQQTKVGGEVSIRLADDKNATASVYDSFDLRHGRNDMVGIRMMFKYGKSYEEELIEKQAREILEIRMMLKSLDQCKAK